MTSIVCASVHVRTYTHVRKRRDGGKRCEGERREERRANSRVRPRGRQDGI